MSSITGRAIDLARAEVGYKEGKRNWTKYSRDDFPTVQNQAWCGSFVGWIYHRAGFAIGAYVWVPYVPYVENWAKKNGFWKTNRAKAGDLTIYGFGKSSGQHIGIAWPDESTGGDSYRAIEGNTSSGNSGSQVNGDGVYVRYRKRSTIRGWVDMEKALAHYKVADPKPVKKPEPKPVVKKTAPKAPAFPLPRDKRGLYFYGPADGPKTSVSGRTRNTAVPQDVTKDGNGRWRSKGLYAWQKQMKSRGWNIDVHGKFDAKTERVVRQFQANKKLGVDGKIGPDTWSAAWEVPVT